MIGLGSARYIAVWPLLLVLEAATVPLVVAQPAAEPAAKAGGDLRAAQDRSFSMDLAAATSSPNVAPYMSFAVCQDRIFVVRHAHRGEAPRSHEFRLRRAPARKGVSMEPGSTDPFPSRAPLPMSLAATSGRVGFYDTEARSLVMFDPSGGVEEIAAGDSLISGFGRFRNGNLIAVSRTMKPRPLDSHAELATGRDDEDLEASLDYSYGLRGYDLFLTDSRLHVIKPLAEKIEMEGLENTGVGAGEWLSLRGPEVAENILGRRYVRMNESGTLAAVFSMHHRGISIYSPDGDLVTVLTHPGRGRKLRANEAFVRLAPTGTDIFFQTDVAFWGETLLVADPSRKTVWERRLDAEEWTDHRLSYQPMQLEISAEGLFILDPDGNLRRYELIWG